MEHSYLPLILFVIAMTGTPGPGNLAMMAIGQATGFRSALPFLCGTALGMAGVNLLAGYGLGGLMRAFPIIDSVLKVLGTAYILYLAVKVWNMRPRADSSANGPKRRFTLAEGALVHPLSPKTWAMVVVGFSQFADPSASLNTQVAVSLAAFGAGLLTFHSLWCLAGAALLRMLTGSNRALACVNGTLVFLMVGATVYALFI